jgi:hypothetical protein
MSDVYFIYKEKKDKKTAQKVVALGRIRAAEDPRNGGKGQTKGRSGTERVGGVKQR